MSLEFLVYKRYAAVKAYTGTDKFIMIPDTYMGKPVAEIHGAFISTELKGVLIPRGLLVIGTGAFGGCPNLEFVGYKLDDEELNKRVLEEGEKIVDLDQPVWKRALGLSVMPPGLRLVENQAFAGTSIRRMEFQSTEIELGDGVFERCRNLDMISFFSCENLILGDGVFSHSGIIRFYAPKARLDTVPDETFENCGNLTSVMVRFTGVGKKAFYRCGKLKKLDMPQNLMRIGPQAFDGCDQLETKPHSKKAKRLSKWDDALEDLFPNSAKRERPRREQLEKLVRVLAGIKENKQKMEAAEQGQRVDKRRNWLQFPAEPLFQLELGSDIVLTKPLPGAISGKFDFFCSHFTLNEKRDGVDIKLKCNLGQRWNEIVPILQYAVHKNLRVGLCGVMHGSIYFVEGIVYMCEDDGKTVLGVDVLRELVTRLKQPAVARGDEDQITPFYLSRDSEVDAMMEIGKSRLPGWVLAAVRRNQQTLKEGSSHYEKDNARKAIQILLSIDWAPRVLEVPTILEAKKIFDETSFGMDQVKERGLEILAQIRHSKELPKWGILLNGPAGVGKTCFAKAFAKALKMPLIQMDMSTIGKEAETISGTSRIYANARPGMLLDEMYANRSDTAILLANEIDKAGGAGGEGSKILLTLLDKTGFYENYLECVVRTDHLYCIATCNDKSKISKPLLDRFIVVDIPPYNEEEKKGILTDYVLPQGLEQAHVPVGQIQLTGEAVQTLVSDYALEPGARDLEQYVQRFIGNYSLNRELTANSGPKTYTEEDVKALFGPSKKVSQRFAIRPGQVNGAFLHEGVAHFFLVEASIRPGTGKFDVLGPIPELQKEYAKVAYCCVGNTTTCDLSKYDVTVFVPQAIPEGAANHIGLACYGAICSEILNINLALTDVCFVGGCDLNGSLYWSESYLTPLLRAMKSQGMATLYAPLGTSELIDGKTNRDCRITVIESVDAKTLFSLAATRDSLG